MTARPTQVTPFPTPNYISFQLCAKRHPHLHLQQLPLPTSHPLVSTTTTTTTTKTTTITTKVDQRHPVSPPSALTTDSSPGPSAVYPPIDEQELARMQRSDSQHEQVGQPVPYNTTQHTTTQHTVAHSPIHNKRKTIQHTPFAHSP